MSERLFQILHHITHNAMKLSFSTDVSTHHRTHDKHLYMNALSLNRKLEFHVPISLFFHQMVLYVSGTKRFYVLETMMRVVTTFILALC